LSTYFLFADLRLSHTNICICLNLLLRLLCNLLLRLLCNLLLHLLCNLLLHLFYVLYSNLLDFRLAIQIYYDLLLLYQFHSKHLYLTLGCLNSSLILLILFLQYFISTDGIVNCLHLFNQLLLHIFLQLTTHLLLIIQIINFASSRC
jgi:hypothetical protein